MATTRLIAPGVYINENDQSFIAQGVSEIGAAFVGPTQKGEAFTPITVTSYDEFQLKFGSSDGNSYMPLNVKEYMSNASVATIVRVLGLGGYEHESIAHLTMSGSFGQKVVGTFHRSTEATSTQPTEDLSGSTVVHTAGNDTFNLNLIGSKTGTITSYAASLESTSGDYIGKLISNTAVTDDIAYAYQFFENSLNDLYDTDPSASLDVQFTDLDLTVDYNRASTPYVTSQTIGGSTKNLFKLYTRSTGVYANSEIKIAIENIQFDSEVPGSDYGTFDIVVREISDNDRQQKVLESFPNLTLDTTSPDYIARRIGDKLPTYSNGKIINKGDYDTLSEYIIVEVTDGVKNSTYSSTLVPWGFKALIQPTQVPTNYTLPSASYISDQVFNSQYNSRIHYGFDFDSDDNLQYLLPVETTAVVGANLDFSLDNYTINTDAPEDAGSAIKDSDLVSARQFVFPVQGGFDGYDPATTKNMGEDLTATNTMGFDMSSSTASGSVAYTRALSLLSDAYQYDFNLLFTPGLINSLHSFSTNQAIEMCENRGDAFYILDTTAISATVKQAASSADSLDTNYAGTYYPWTRVLDSDRNQFLWTPPSVTVARALAYNDRFGYEWFAPAGVNRGNLSTVVDAYVPLNKADVDTLYKKRINPIITFPNNGYVTWGQKTLQTQSSALDRVNVRRLLINVKKFIAGVGKTVLFDPNTRATRTALENRINPYLDDIVQKQGLYAFRVVLDETINTPDVIDRNIMAGKLYLQPVKSAEIISMDLNIQSSGLLIDE